MSSDPIQKSGFIPATRKHTLIALFSVAAITAHLILRFGFHASAFTSRTPLFATLIIGGIPLVFELLVKLWKREFGSDLLAGISIVTSVLLEEYLAGSLVVLMLSGGEALENYAVRSASSVLQALARRMPSAAHRKRGAEIEEVSLDRIAIGDTLLVYPHGICPVDGVVVEGRGVMDESYLTGEPFRMSKTPGAEVLSGAINGETALTIRATRLAVDSRYEKIMQVMRACEHQRPRLRRLADQLGAFYTPLAVAVALAAWIISGQADRFLAVLVVATPCPLLIAIPVAIIGAISLSAKCAIIVKNPGVLEQIETCRTVIFDKTGTLTYGEPKLTEQLCAPGFAPREVLLYAASLERYSKHPLARAILSAAEEAGIPLQEATEISERPGEGLRGTVDDRKIQITSRRRIAARYPSVARELPAAAGGLECCILIDDAYAATYRFRDKPRLDGVSFVGHLKPKHRFEKVMLVSGDRESEVRYLADWVGISEVHSGKSPEEKLAIVQAETRKARTLFLGDGINDAPALLAATVGVAFGQTSDITAEAAGAVIMNTSLEKVDEFLHISSRMRVIALQSAIGGMSLSLAGMILAALGHLPPVAGAVSQEVIDVLVVLNALRAAFPPKALADFHDFDIDP
ncbi:MAG: cadmium-translocating P-type ATPase [Planctomycetes bacterium]|nr:cadmium-translocating P-type ATPase [Planctomycetota bacterium]